MANPNPSAIQLTVGYFDTILNGFISQVSSAFLIAVAPVIVVGMTIHFSLLAYSIIRGEQTDPMSKIIKDAVNAILIIGIALSFASYNTFVVDGVKAIQGFFISGITGGATNNIDHQIDDIWGGQLVKYGSKKLTAYDALFQIAEDNKSTIGIPELRYFIAACILYVASAILAVLCLIPYWTSKIYLSILLGLGPVFITASLWPATRNYFSAWLSNLIGNTLTICLISAVCSFCSIAYKDVIDKIINKTNPEVLSSFQPLYFSGAVLVVCVFLGIIALHTSQQGAQLAGGGLAMDSKGVAGMITQSIMTKMIFGTNKDKNQSNTTSSQNASSNQQQPENSVSKPARLESAGYAAGRALSRIANGLSSRD